MVVGDTLVKKFFGSSIFISVSCSTGNSSSYCCYRSSSGCSGSGRSTSSDTIVVCGSRTSVSIAVVAVVVVLLIVVVIGSSFICSDNGNLYEFNIDICFCTIRYQANENLQEHENQRTFLKLDASSIGSHGMFPLSFVAYTYVHIYIYSYVHTYIHI